MNIEIIGYNDVYLIRKDSVFSSACYDTQSAAEKASNLTESQELDLWMIKSAKSPGQPVTENDVDLFADALEQS